MAQDGDATGRYRGAGVDIDAGARFVEGIKALARSTARPGATAELGGFGAVFDLAASGFRDPLLVAATDGAGTKVLLAAEAGRFETIGVDLVAMCVNDLVVQGAEPLFFLDYLATARLDAAAGMALLEGVARGCREAGCALIGGETAEMPGLYRPGHLDLAGFAVGAVERGALLPRPNIAAGDVLLGLPADGVHANGYSLVRALLREQGLGLGDPAPFDAGRTLAEALLRPTRIYVRSALAAIASGGVKALAHITGGGLLDNVPRALPDGLVARIDTGRWALPPVFAWLAEAGRLDAHELARTFNCGIGLVLVVDRDRAETLRQQLAGSIAIGRLEAASGPPRVELSGTEQAWPTVAPPS